MSDVISKDLSVSIVDTAVCGDVMSDVLCEDVSVSFEDIFVVR